MVNWLAFGGRMEDIHTAMISLSKYYRLILNKGQDTLTLSEELQHVGYYIKIQDIRFPGKLTFVEEVDRELLPSIVPKIILQPLVENAIQHGIWEKPEKRGTIRIWGYEESGIALSLIHIYWNNGKDRRNFGICLPFRMNSGLCGLFWQIIK